jgi:hypothetical protein
LKVTRFNHVIQKFEGHYVLATGKTNGIYDIIDPGSILVHTLDSPYDPVGRSYNNTFSAMATFVPPGSGAFVIYADAGIQVLVTDPVGRHVGYKAGTIINEIPRAYYADEEVGEDDPNASVDHSLPMTHILSIPSPSEGFYQIQITGLQATQASLRIYRYNKKNLPQTVQTISTNLGPGQTLLQTTTYSTRTGDVNGDGFVNDTDIAIVQAALGTKLGDPAYNPAADLNGDGVVDMFDLAIVKSAGDTITPTTLAVLSPQPNAAGWNNSNVTATLMATDNAGGSGVKQVGYSATGAQTILATNLPGNTATITIAAEGATTITFFASDNAGNVEAVKSLTIYIDKTSPAIIGTHTPAPNVNGWNTTPVAVNFQCADNLSGLAAGSPPPPTLLSTEGAGQSVSGICTDLAGNSASAIVQSINIDMTPPVVSCSANPSVLWPPNQQLVRVNISVVLSDFLSGPAGFTLVLVSTNEPDSGSGDILGFTAGKASTSGQLRATRLGSGNGRVYTFTYIGTDRAGNSAICSTSVTVPHDQGIQ